MTEMTAQLDGKAVYLEEPSSNMEPDAEIFVLKLGINGQEVELNLCALRQAKRLLAEGEKRLLLRQEQATLRRNLSLDFSS